MSFYSLAREGHAGSGPAGRCEWFALLNTMVPGWIFLAIMLSLIPHDMMYGPQAALIAECFTGRLRYSGASIGYQLASVFAGGPAPLIATALFAEFRSGYAIALYILVCAVISFAAALLLPDYTNRDISREYDKPASRSRPFRIIEEPHQALSG
jgi:hypothetical protein